MRSMQSSPWGPSMIRLFSFLAALVLGAAAATAAPLDNRDGFWSEWSDATFSRAAAEKKFVILSLQSWWCPWCHVMNRDTWASAEVRAALKDHFIPVHVDQDSRPDISQRYERFGWPATIIFGPDGTEIVKLRGFYSPKFLIPILQETIKDPSPVDYGTPGGPERERTLATALGLPVKAAATRPKRETAAVLPQPAPPPQLPVLRIRIEGLEDGTIEIPYATRK